MSLLDRIDDAFAAQHNIPRELIPRFEPCNGNEGARLLFVLERPGPKSVGTREAGGSGVISQHNNDPSARMLKEQLALAGLGDSDLCITNIVPHVRSSRAKVSSEQVTGNEIRIGFARLLGVMDGMPNLRDVILVGRKAQRVKRQLRQSRPSVRIHEVYHTSAQASGGGRDPSSSKHHMWLHNVGLLKSL